MDDTSRELQAGFYAMVAEKLKRNLPDCDFGMDGVSAIVAKTVHPAVLLVIGNHAPTTARAEVHIRSEHGKDETVRLFGILRARKDEVEAVVGNELRWFVADKADDAAVQIRIRWNIVERDRWERISSRLVEHMVVLERAFRSAIAELPTGPATRN